MSRRKRSWNGGVRGQNADHTCLIFHRKDLALSWSKMKTHCMVLSISLTGFLADHSGLLIKIASKQGRLLGKATAIIQTRDQAGLVQGGRSRVVWNGKILDIFWKQCQQYFLMFWVWAVKERHQFWAPWTRRIQCFELNWGNLSEQVWSKGRQIFWFQTVMFEISLGIQVDMLSRWLNTCLEFNRSGLPKDIW